jgi:hypothetical protein
MNPSRSEVWIINGTAPLPLFPENINKIEVNVEVDIDGGMIKKKSGKRLISITTVGTPTSIPDTEGSQT